MRIRLLETAKDDLGEAWRFYERISTGLGDHFLDCLKADIGALMFHAGVHQMSSGFYRMLAKRFPFAVYYLIEDDRVDVYAVLDCRRSPEWTVRRLGRDR